MSVVTQLVTREPLSAPDTSRGLAVVPNPNHSAPETFEDASTQALLLGSSDLVELSTSLAKLDFRPLSVELVDRRFNRIDADLTDELGDALLTLISQGDIAAVRGFHESPGMDGIFVAQIRLRNRDTGSIFSLAQDGVLMADEANTQEFAQKLADVMHLRLVE
ncbi:hypothetical protein [Rhodococcus globerulus]|uniref:DUF1795 domain-containing protein n=1 Tax=Rhodococcus globerulus TaxID=33008 RepID=A0ABU4C3N6_RHOGO|nr:hypothetical protein [Rhodococcus globerulus]MDV6271122.1 hypothetical protein [Rhodococcus globerulus]